VTRSHALTAPRLGAHRGRHELKPFGFAQHAASGGDVAIDGRGVAPVGETLAERGSAGMAESVPGKAATVGSRLVATTAGDESGARRPLNDDCDASQDEQPP
jgi:hypothetical protein